MSSLPFGRMCRFGVAPARSLTKAARRGESQNSIVPSLSPFAARSSRVNQAAHRNSVTAAAAAHEKLSPSQRGTRGGGREKERTVKQERFACSLPACVRGERTNKRVEASAQAEGEPSLPLLISLSPTRTCKPTALACSLHAQPVVVVVAPSTLPPLQWRTLAARQARPVVVAIVVALAPLAAPVWARFASLPSPVLPGTLNRLKFRSTGSGGASSP